MSTDYGRMILISLGASDHEMHNLKPYEKVQLIAEKLGLGEGVPNLKRTPIMTHCTPYSAKCPHCVSQAALRSSLYVDPRSQHSIRRIQVAGVTQGRPVDLFPPGYAEEVEKRINQ